jgi:hypothetical protein
MKIDDKKSSKNVDKIKYSKGIILHKGNKKGRKGL